MKGHQEEAGWTERGTQHLMRSRGSLESFSAPVGKGFFRFLAGKRIVSGSRCGNPGKKE